MKRNTLAALALAVGVALLPHAVAADWKYIEVVEYRSSAPSPSQWIWVNTDHLVVLDPCNPYADSPACLHFDHLAPADDHRGHRTVLPFAQAARFLLDLDNPTTPRVSMLGPASAVINTEVQLTATVTDPDYGDTYTLTWELAAGAEGTGRVMDMGDGTATFVGLAPGASTVVATATDSAGQVGSAQHAINVVAQ